MTHPSVHVQIAPTSVPSTPSWLGEVAVVAHVFSQLGLQKAIEERVRFVRARMGDYEVIDFVVMLIGYAVSGERTLQSFYQRLLPFAEPFMALFGRANQCRAVHGTVWESKPAASCDAFPLSRGP